MKIRIDTWGRTLVAASLVLATFTACEKKNDYTVPAGEDNLEKDIKASFDIISADNKKWLWPLTIASDPFDNEGMGFVTTFRKDSTADAQLIAKQTIVKQLDAVLASGKLDADQTDMAQQLLEIYQGYPDWYLRDLLFNNEANADFITYTEYVLPNIVHFNPIILSDAESGFRYNVNGPVQLSLTFTNTTLFPQLKQGGVLDYDFRIFSFTPEKIELNGYYNNSSNKESVLYATDPDATTLFANGSNIFVPEASLLIGSCGIKANGATVSVPSGYTGLSYFYKYYDQMLIPHAGRFGFGLGSSTNVSASLKSSAYYAVKAAFTGSLSAIPAGTVLVSLAGYNSDGVADGRVVEFIKS